MDREYDLLPDADTVPDVKWDIRREGHAWDGEIARPRRHLAPDKIELAGGQLFYSEAQRLTMLALLLENVGVDKAIRLGDPEVWREAIANLSLNKQVSASDLIEAIVSEGHAQGMDALNAAQQTVFLIADLDTEAAINGLLGYYSNSAGNHAIEVVEALKQIGAIESADLINTANVQFPNSSPPCDRVKRNKLLQRLDESAKQRIGKVGNTFMERPDDLGEKFEAFILANLTELTQ